MKTEINVKLIEKVIISIRQGGFSENKLNMLEQALALPPQFYKGQQGSVSNNTIHWHNAILLNITEAGFVCIRGNKGVSPWHHFKPNPDAVTLPVWLPMSSVIGDKMFDLVDEGYVHISKDKTMYTIIPPYEVLS